MTCIEYFNLIVVYSPVYVGNELAVGLSVAYISDIFNVMVVFNTHRDDVKVPHIVYLMHQSI